MDNTVERARFSTLLQHLDRLLSGIAAMDDQWQARETRRIDMRAKYLALALPRTVLVVVIETGLTDADHLGIAGEFHQPGGVGVRLACRLMRVDANRAPHIGE